MRIIHLPVKLSKPLPWDTFHSAQPHTQAHATATVYASKLAHSSMGELLAMKHCFACRHFQPLPRHLSFGYNFLAQPEELSAEAQACSQAHATATVNVSKLAHSSMGELIAMNH